jgi:predicted ribosome quality control (RQC) complex YloA/Tae2 family protein
MMIQRDSSSTASIKEESDGPPMFVSSLFGSESSDVSSWEDDDDDTDESSFSFGLNNDDLMLDEKNDSDEEWLDNDFGPAATILGPNNAELEPETAEETSLSSSSSSSSTSDTDDSDILLLLLENEFRSWQQATVKADESLRRKQDSLRLELEKSRQVEQTIRRANLLKSNLYLFNNNNDNKNGRSALVHDWETGADVQLDVDEQYYSATEEMEALFGHIRKLKRGANTVEPLLHAAEMARAQLLRLKEDLDQCGPGHADDEQQSVLQVDTEMFQRAKDRLGASKDITGFRPPADVQPSRATANNNNKIKNSSSARAPALGTPASNVRKLQSPAGSTILVGRNRRGNEYLSTSYAKGADIWLHARGTPGAHVVVPRRRGSPAMTDDCLQLAADLAAFYSDGRTERKVLVSVTEAKHLSKPRGAAMGAVNLREELQVLTGRPDYAPDELKEARAVSGRSDEYRAADKAKLRKQSQKQTKRMKETYSTSSSSAKRMAASKKTKQEG